MDSSLALNRLVEKVYVYAHLVLDQAGEIGGGQHAAEMIFTVKHGDGVFKILLDTLDADVDRLGGVDIGIGGRDDRIKIGAVSRDDQILEVDRADEGLLVIGDVYR